MRPDLVVEETELAQCLIERRKRFHGQAIKLRLQRAEKALHPSVLPRAAGIGSLMLDAEQQEGQAKRPGSEDRFVVRSDRPWLAVAADHRAEL